LLHKSVLCTRERYWEFRQTPVIFGDERTAVNQAQGARGNSTQVATGVYDVSFRGSPVGSGMANFAVVPERLALVNVDVQRCFVSDSPLACPDGPVVLERINRAAAACRAAGILVVHVSHVLRADGSNTGVLGEISSIVRQGIISAGSPSAALHPDLVVDPRDVLVEKPRFGAFHATDLELILRGRGIDSIIVTGIATNVCCDTTAREAFARDFRVFFLSDGTANSAIDELSADDVKRVTCATLGRRFAQILTVDEMIGRIADASRQRGGPSGSHAH
jgi:ureidoacrylate peracid hydrolase